MAPRSAEGLPTEVKGKGMWKRQKARSGDLSSSPGEEDPGSTNPSSQDVHRLGNLISVIIAEAQLIQAEYGPGTPAHESAMAIERAARALEQTLCLSSACEDSSESG